MECRLRRPRLALLLLRAVDRRLRRLVDLVESLSFQEVVHRLAGHVLDRVAAGIPFEIETNARFASLVGAALELVSRNLARLHQSGAIELAGRTVVQLDRPMLEELAEAAGR